MDALARLRTTLAGRYELEREIGRGGMATVYLATDAKHRRPVALKVLNPELGAVLGSERFLAEIQVTANLQHPNLLPLFDSGEADGLLFYVMPFIEGESLRARLDRERQLPIEDALRIAMGVASALEYAHSRGVVHRDLKPENILLRDGQPLVADFGIALAVTKAGGARVTQTGLSLGTPQYMSPEQAMGDRVIDGRADIYSLGAVTYEMLTGEPPHAAGTAQGVIAKLMTEEPRPLMVLRRNVPPRVDAAVRRALEKLPADRFATGRAFADALQGKDGTYVPAISSGSARPRLALLLACGAAAAFAVIAAWAWTGAARAPESMLVRYKLDFPSGERFEDAEGVSLAIAPDGRTIAYLARNGPAPRSIFVRRLDALTSRVLPGTENAMHPRFSWDGRWISFMGADARLSKVPVEGGTASFIASVSDWGGNTWGASSDVIYASGGSIWRATATGGSAVRIARPDTTEQGLGYFDPFVLPDGDHVVYVTESSFLPTSISRLGMVSIADSTRRVTSNLVGAMPLGYLDDGWLIYGRQDQTIAAIRFDPRTARASGDAVTLLDGVFWKYNGATAATLSRSGSLIYLRGGSNSTLSVLDGHGALLATAGEPRWYNSPSWSSDGNRIAVEVLTPSAAISAGIWMFDVRSGVFSRVTSRVSAERPSWTADGKRIAFINADDKGSSVWSVPADGSGPEELFYSLSGKQLREVTFSPDGRYAVFRANERNEPRTSLWLLPLQGEHRAVPFVQTPFNAGRPAVSPNSKWVAYESDATGLIEIYLRALPGPGGVLQVSSGGGTEPRWLPDGRLVYRDGRAFRTATLSAGDGTPTVVRRDSLFADIYRTSADRQSYDIARDGRFLVARDAAEGRDVIIAVNWLAEVRAKLRGK